MTGVLRGWVAVGAVAGGLVLPGGPDDWRGFNYSA
ncbi:hypothetical protein QFZ82_005011 [Streptomyces sp. V4I23]|nr:hypothetical protein [Streptomyces sp. V4I23]